MNEEVEAILNLVANFKYEISSFDIMLRKLYDHRFCVTFDQIGRSEDPKDDEPSWEEIFDNAREAVEYFVFKSHERHGERIIGDALS